jgi:hypothetical protein
MAEAEDFAQKAEEAEALAACTENPLLRMTLRILAQDYRVLAERDHEPPRSGTVSSKVQQQHQDQSPPGPSLKEGGVLR